MLKRTKKIILLFSSVIFLISVGCTIEKKDYSKVCHTKDFRIRGSQKAYYLEEIKEKLKKDVAKSHNIKPSDMQPPFFIITMGYKPCDYPSYEYCYDFAKENADQDADDKLQKGVLSQINSINTSKLSTAKKNELELIKQKAKNIPDKQKLIMKQQIEGFNCNNNSAVVARIYDARLTKQTILFCRLAQAGFLSGDYPLCE